MISEAIIFAAGEGKRLRNSFEKVRDKYIREILKNNIPKPLVPIPKYGKPLIVWILESIYKIGIKKAILVINPGKEDIFRRILFGSSNKELYGEHTLPDIEVEFAYQEIPKGTADSLYVGAKKIDSDYFLVLNGDDLIKLPKLNKERTIFIYEVDNSKQYGSVIIEGEYIKEIKEKKGETNVVYTGASIWIKEDVEFYFEVPEINGEKRITDLINILVKNGRRFVWKNAIKWIPVNTYEQWNNACKLIENGF